MAIRFEDNKGGDVKRPAERRAEPKPEPVTIEHPEPATITGKPDKKRKGR